MLMLAAFVFLILFGIAIACGAREYSDRRFVGIAFCLVGGVLLFVTSVTCITSRVGARDRIIQFNAFKATLEEARTHRGLTDLERAAITVKIAEWNEWLASEQYWSTGQFQWWHLAEVNSMEPLK